MFQLCMIFEQGTIQGSQSQNRVHLSHIDLKGTVTKQPVPGEKEKLENGQVKFNYGHV